MAPTSKTDPSLSRAQSHVGHSRGGGARLGAAPHPVQGPGHPLGPPGPAHPFPGSDLLSPSSSLLSRGPVSQEAEATENQAGPGLLGPAPATPASAELSPDPARRCPTRGQWAGLPGVAGGAAAPPLAPGRSGPSWWVVSRWSGAACRGPATRPGRGGLDRMPPQRPLRAGHPPVGWGVAQAGRSAGRALPTPHTHSEACRGRAGKDPKGQACEEGKVLDSRLSTEVRSGESCPHPPCLCGFSQSPFPASAQPGQCRPLRMAGGRWEGALGGSSAHRTAVQPPGDGRVWGAWGAGTQGPHRAAGTSVEPGSCPLPSWQRLGHFLGPWGWGSWLQAPLCSPVPSGPRLGLQGADSLCVRPFVPVPNLLQAGEWCEVTPSLVTACGGLGVTLLPRSQALSTETLSSAGRSTSTPPDPKPRGAPLQEPPVVPPRWGCCSGYKTPALGADRRPGVPGKGSSLSSLQTPRPTPSRAGRPLPHVVSSHSPAQHAQPRGLPSGARTGGSDLGTWQGGQVGLPRTMNLKSDPKLLVGPKLQSRPPWVLTPTSQGGGGVKGQHRRPLRDPLAQGGGS